MLNIIWPIFIIISIGYSFITGNLENVNNSIFEVGDNTINLILTLLGTVCLWNGIMKIAENTSLIKKISNLLNPFMRILFPEIKKGTEAYEEISMNIVSNILGLGNAATPLGLRAMKSMQKENKDKNKLSNSMAMFIIINTASIQLIPTTVIAIRTSLGSAEPTKMLLPIWGATVGAAIAGVLCAKVLMKKF